jgi:cytochrome c
VGLCLGAGAIAGEGQDKAMLELAGASGCVTCHQIEPGDKSPSGMASVGPAWRDVAVRYRGQAGAAGKLTTAVLAGSSPYDSHWTGKASGVAMPPNKVAISPQDARRLVDWILALGPPGR